MPILEFKTKSKLKSCNRGYPCGGSCISRGFNCRKKLTNQGKNYADWLKQSAVKLSSSKSEKSLTGTNKKPVAKEVATASDKDASPSLARKDMSRPLARSPLITPSQSSFSSIDRGFPPDSKTNKRLNTKLEKELANLEKQASKRAKQNPSLYSDNQNIILATQQAHMYRPEGTRIARSANGGVEAVANFQDRDRSVYIDFLATAPKNIDRNDPEYMRGSGTKMIMEAVKESIEKGKGGAVTLCALPGAVKFYKKLGFKRDPNSSHKNGMALSRKNSQKLLDMALNFQEMRSDPAHILGALGSAPISFVDELEILELEAKGAFANRGN